MKKNSDTISCIAAGFVALFFLILPFNVFAGMAVSPLSQWVEVKPGEEVPFTITVSNVNRGPGTVPCSVNVEVLDFTVTPMGKLLFGEEFKHKRSAVDLISLDENVFTLQPGEFREIKAKVSAPLNADGDYWATLMVKLGNPGENESGAVTVNLQTASGIFVHVARRNYIKRLNIVDANVVLPNFDIKPEFADQTDGEQALVENQNEQVLKINAEVKNEGLIAALVKGKAYLYSQSRSRIAAIPMHTSRRRIFPGHTRIFTGQLPQSLPAGKYKLQLTFDSKLKYCRKAIKEIEFSIGNKMADRWSKKHPDNTVQELVIEPKSIIQTITAGRFTTAPITVSNKSLGTASVSCSLKPNELPEGWVTLKSNDFTLAPNMKRNAICFIRIPKNAKKGRYNGTILLEAERSELIQSGKDNVEKHEIPISIITE